MKLSSEQRRSFWILLFVVVVQAGCADGPMPYINSMNPMTRSQWDADEQYQPTLHRQLGEVEALRDTAASMSADQQVHWSRELTHILKTNDNPLLRQAAVGVLAECTVPEAADGLRVAQKDPDSSVRIAVCKAWSKRDGDESAERLAEILGSDTDLDVRLAAARGLGEFPRPVSLTALGLALDDPDPALQHRVIESLRKTSGRDYGADVSAWQQFAQGNDPGPETVPSMAERVRRWF